ncbi:MAG: crossover junction endodeoxyribonuclease RuvC [Chlamydiae bacterium]|nr:crossover junction endodeoxyribonuclease RuvC [Chlamydiota bacterium]
MIVIGVDPGTHTSGYGLIDTDANKVLDYGCIKPPTNLSPSKRYLIIYQSVLHLIEKFSPSVCSIETQFIYKNPKSALTLGMAKGAAMIACAQKDVEVFEYNPSQVKAAVTGNGKSTKEQVGYMIRILCHLKEVPRPLDAADALALCFCHINRSKLCMNMSVARL